MKLPVDPEDVRLRNALRVGLIYLVISAAWIYLSDAAVDRLVADPGAVRRWQTYKGWAFVLGSAALIVFLVHRELTRVRRSARRFRALVEQSLVGVYVIRAGRFLYVNPRLAEIFGYEPAEMIESVGVADVVDEDDRGLVLGNLALREEGREQELRYRFTGRRSDGERLRLEVHGRRVRWEGAPAVLGILLDVGERERLEERMRATEKMEALGKLTGQVAHDFNNFLTAIIGPLDLCLDRLAEESDERFEVEAARETAVRAASLSRKLLAFSRHRPSVPEIVDVNAIVREMEPLLRRLTGAPVDLVLEPDASPCTVRMDPSDVEQVVMNLALNAAEAAGEGTVTVRTRRTVPPSGRPEGPDAPPSDGRVWLEVEDDGVGIEEDVRDRLFEPFFTTKASGTGLGLSTVFGVAKQAGGTVDVESEPGEGSVFRVVLPAEVEEPATPDERREPPSEVGRGGESILLIEDETAVREVTTRALERFGYTVREAETGEGALALAADDRIPFELVVADVQLPDRLGPDVVEAIAELRPGVRVLYTSGYSDAEITAQLAETPDVRLLEKPFTVEELLGAVREALEAEGRAEGDRTG